MAREIQPTPVLEGQEALDFLNKLDNYKDYLKEKGIVLDRREIEESARFLKSIFKESSK
ncbi:hypothetical protein [Capnocytophaga leadbetteri]